MPDDFEEKYLDVLHNIEFGVVHVFRRHPEMTDWDVLKVLEALVKLYKAETTNYPTPVFSLNPLTQELFDSVHAACELHLGRGKMLDQKGKPVKLSVEAISIDEILACLKRIRRSVEMWNKENGRQGYLAFIEDFML